MINNNPQTIRSTNNLGCPGNASWKGSQAATSLSVKISSETEKQSQPAVTT